MKKNVKAELEALLQTMGGNVKRSAVEVLKFTEERTAHAQAHADEVGIIADEARNVLLFAGIDAAHTGDANDAAARGKVFGFILALIAASVP